MSEASTWYQLNHGRRPLGMLPLCALAVVWREDEIEAMVRNDARGDLLYERIDRLTVHEQPGVIDRTEPMKQRSGTIIKLIAVAGFALSIATPAQALTPAPFPEPEGMITQIAAACGAGRTRINGVCVARTTARQTRRAVRRCATGITC